MRPLFLFCALTLVAGCTSGEEESCTGVCVDTCEDGTCETSGDEECASCPSDYTSPPSEPCPELESDFASEPDSDGDGLPDSCDPFTAEEECTGSGWSPPASLPTVLADCDLDANPACSGEDIALALAACAELDGCIVQLEAGTYDDTAINIYDGVGDDWGHPHGCQPEHTHCSTESFSNGLVIQGRGAATVVRPPVYSGSDTPLPILRLNRRPDLQFRMRNLVLDGRKEDLDSLTQLVNTWHHKGLEVGNYFAPELGQNVDGCVHNVVARNFSVQGVSVTHASGWIIEHSTAEEIGCHDTFSPCPKLESTVPAAPDSDGYRTPGYGFVVGDYSDDLTIRSCTMRRITKYSLSIKSVDDDGPGVVSGVSVHDNVISDSGSRGIFVAGAEGAWVADNLIEESHDFGLDGALTYDDLAGLTINGTVSGSRFERNTIRNVAGAAIRYYASGTGNVLQDTLISGSCKRRNPTSCNTATGGCYGLPDIGFAPSSAGDVVLDGTSVTDSDCYQALATSPDSDMDLTVDGGLYVSGRYSQSEQPFTLDNPNAYHIYYGGTQHAGIGTWVLAGGVTFKNEEDPNNPGAPLNPLVEGVVLAFGEAVVVVKDADFIDYGVDIHLDDHLEGGTVIDCDAMPMDPLCQ